MTRLLTTEIDHALTRGAVLVTPNQRLARACLADYAQLRIDEGLLGWQTPQVVPYNTWLQSLYRDLFATGRVSKFLLSQEQSLAMWREILNQSESQAILSPGATAVSIAKAWELENAWLIDQSPASMPQTEDQLQYEGWKKQYLDACSLQESVDIAGLSRYLIESLSEEDQVLPSEIVLFGFPEVASGMQRFLNHIGTLGCRVVKATPKTIEASGRSVVTCTDDEAELQQCARWARQYFEDDTDSSATIGIVIPDLHARRDQVVRVFDAVFFPAASPIDIEKLGRPYDVSLGLPLSRFAPVDHALMFLEFTFDRLSGGELSRLLLSPYLADASLEHDARAAYDARLRSDRIRSLGVGGLRKDGRTPALLKHVVERVGDEIQLGRATPSVWLDRFVDVLGTLGWPGDIAPDSVDFQAIEAWFQALEDLQGLDEIIGVLSWRSMLMLLNEHIAGLIFQPQTPELPIQILGVLESQGLTFNALRVLGMDNESWPPVTSASPYLPLQWQKLARIPGAANDLDMLRNQQVVQSWLVSANEIIFSHSSHRNGNELQSALVLSDFNVKPIDVAVGETDSASKLISELISLSGVADYTGPVVSSDIRVGGGARLFEDQAYCPFRAFAMHRLGVRELEEPGLGIDARDKGNLFHDTIQFFWQDVKTLLALRTLLESDDAFELQLNKSIDEAFSNTAIAFPTLRDVEKRRVYRVVQQWLVMHEKLRDGFTVRELEEEREFVFGPLQLKLKVDRVDELDTGGSIIIDYKTGKYNTTSSWSEERITSPQLPLYAVLQEKPVDAVCFAQVATNQQKFVGMGVQRGVLTGIKAPVAEDESWVQQLVDWRERLELLAEEIHDGVATVTPGKNACARCPLPSLCRIDATVLDNGEENSQGVDT